jgi:hypothetical protein
MFTSKREDSDLRASSEGAVTRLTQVLAFTFLGAEEDIGDSLQSSEVVLNALAWLFAMVDSDRQGGSNANGKLHVPFPLLHAQLGHAELIAVLVADAEFPNARVEVDGLARGAADGGGGNTGRLRGSLLQVDALDSLVNSGYNFDGHVSL